MSGYVNAYVPKPKRKRRTPVICCEHGRHVKTPTGAGLVRCVCACGHRWTEVSEP